LNGEVSETLVTPDPVGPVADTLVLPTGYGGTLTEVKELVNDAMGIDPVPTVPVDPIGTVLFPSP